MHRARWAMSVICVMVSLANIPAEAAIARYGWNRVSTIGGGSCTGTTTRTCTGFDGGSGTDRVVVVGVGIPTSDLLTSASFGGVAMTCPAGANIQDAGDRRVQFCYLLNSPSGVNDFVFEFSSSPDAFDPYAAAYSGVGSVESVAEDSNAGTTSLPVSLSTSANAVLVSYVRESSGTTVTWTNGITTELGTSGGVHFADSAGVTINAGTTTITPTTGGAVITAHVALSLAEPSNASPKLTLLGVGGQ